MVTLELVILYKRKEVLTIPTSDWLFAIRNKLKK